MTNKAVCRPFVLLPLIANRLVIEVKLSQALLEKSCKKWNISFHNLKPKITSMGVIQVKKKKKTLLWVDVKRMNFSKSSSCLLLSVAVQWYFIEAKGKAGSPC